MHSILTQPDQVAPHPPPVRETGDRVWDRIWTHAPKDPEDDALLDRELRAPRWNMMAQHLQATFGSIEGLRTVELGSGRGDLSVLLAQRGAEVTLLDRSESALNSARRRFDRLGLQATFAQGDLLGDLAPWRGRFDLSLSAGVIEHFAAGARTDVIRAHYEVLRPGGCSIISVPHAWCIPYRLWKSYLEIRRWWPYGLEIPYSKAEIRRRAVEVGFRRVETASLGFWESVGVHWFRGFFGRRVDWSSVSSPLDRWMGSILLMFARRGGSGAGESDDGRRVD